MNNLKKKTFLLKCFFEQTIFPNKQYSSALILLENERNRLQINDNFENERIFTEYLFKIML